ncbi:putative fatty acyl-CoA reductase CG5065 [Schistocerca gregaria]|uniref:putative fatty acyl-CoA reductase CG5065 n=1 Tax=Schistocerca gregaria TaxID=7010 RepID=UPI00211F387A|nr:putative fatty acyl-CoA reductase CG5065 [Schistocerca gregaria]
MTRTLIPLTVSKDSTAESRKTHAASRAAVLSDSDFLKLSRPPVDSSPPCDFYERRRRLQVFDRLRQTGAGSALQKLRAVAGDAAAPGLALSAADAAVLEAEVSVVFHCAASVSFRQPLAAALLLNVRGTREVALLATRMRRLQAFVHVSTAYSNCDHKAPQEIVYPARGNYMKLIELAENMDPKNLEKLTPELLGNLPNTYVYTKSLAENVINDFRDLLPVAILRPSIVCPALKDPFPGWVDTHNGPMGLLIGASSGILRSLRGDGNMHTDLLPVDFVANSLIAAAWDTAVNRWCKMPVYNCTTSSDMPVTWNELVKIGQDLYTQFPSPKMLWYPSGAIHRNCIVYIICLVLFQFLPAIIVDAALVLSGKKPWLFKLQKKIYEAGENVKYFILNEWSFPNQSLKDLQHRLNKHDQEQFSFDATRIDITDYIKLWVLGYRRFILNLDDASITKAKLKLRRLYIIHLVAKIALCLILSWIAVHLCFKLR